MKKRFIQICSLVGLLIGLTLAAQAQRANRYEADIPFDFNVGGKTFAAGAYAFALTNPLAYQESLTIRDLRSGAAHVFLIARRPATEPPAISRLLFNRYEDRYFLAEITTSTLSAKFIKAKNETRLAATKTRGREMIALKK